MEPASNNVSVLPTVEPSHTETQPSATSKAKNEGDKAEKAPKTSKQVVRKALKKATEDPGAMFKDKVIIALADLEKNDPAEYAGVRGELRKLRLTGQVEALIKGHVNATATAVNEPGQAQDAAGRYLDLLMDQCVLFHDSERVAYIEFCAGEHNEVHPLRGGAARFWMDSIVLRETRRGMGSSTRETVLATMESVAVVEGKEEEVYRRVACVGGIYYIDLVDEAWRVVRITSSSWQLLDKSPVRFVRTNRAMALPEPVMGGSLPLIWQVVNIPEQYRIIVITWIIDALMPDTEYPVLALIGRPGSAKTSSHKFIRSVIDPNKSMVLSMPKLGGGLRAAVKNNHCFSLENVSHLSKEYQDELCKVATGAEDVQRALYSDHDEAAVSLDNPCILNGVGLFITAADLLERSLPIRLDRINSFKTRQEVTELAERIRPQVFGGLLDLFVRALAVDPSKLPEECRTARMQSFAQLGERVAIAQGEEPGEFMNAYNDLRKYCDKISLSAEPVAEALQAYFDDHPMGVIEGTFEQALDTLRAKAVDRTSEFWPRSGKALASKLDYLETTLARVGIVIERDTRRQSDGFHVKISLTGGVDNRMTVVV